MHACMVGVEACVLDVNASACRERECSSIIGSALYPVCALEETGLSAPMCEEDYSLSSVYSRS